MVARITGVAQTSIEDSIKLKQKLLSSNLIAQIEALADDLINRLSAGNKVIFAGNGGSFADSQHLAAEFVHDFYSIATRYLESR